MHYYMHSHGDACWISITFLQKIKHTVQNAWLGENVYTSYIWYTVCVYACTVYEMYACICTGKFRIYYNIYAVAMLWFTKCEISYKWYILSVAPDAYSTIDQRGRRNTLDDTLDRSDRDAPQVTQAFKEKRPLLCSYTQQTTCSH